MEERYKIHAGYILFILLVVILGLVTVKWGDIPQLVQYITFSLTVTSLVLAVLAIIYAFVSNASLGRTLNAVGEASREITTATSTLRGELTAIPTSLRSMEAKLDTISERREEEPTEKPSGKAAQKAESPQASARPQTIDDVAAAFISTTSIWGLITVHACALAYSSKIAFDLNELVTRTERLRRDYVRGFLVATGSAGLVAYKDAHGVINVTGIHDTLRAKTRETLLQKVGGLERAEQREILQKVLERVEAFFSKSS